MSAGVYYFYHLFLILQFSVFVSSALAEDNPVRQINVKGDLLRLFESGDGRPPEKVALKNHDSVKLIQAKFAEIWESAKKNDPPAKLLSSSHRELLFPDGSRITLFANQYCHCRNQWRESESVRDLTTLVMRSLAHDESLTWAPSAISTTYPTDEEKHVMIKRVMDKELTRPKAK